MPPVEKTPARSRWRGAPHALLLAVAPAIAAGFAACSGTVAPDAPPPAWRGAPYAPGPLQAQAGIDALTALGRAMFFDASLSASGKTSCATCHDPGRAHGPPNALPVQLAGRDGRTPGLRAAPSLRYLQTLPPFSEHRFENEGDDSVDAGPSGGHTWDGRAGSAHEQARLPLLSASEMANASPDEVAARLRTSACAASFRKIFGAGVLDDPRLAFDAAVMALEVFQQSAPEFYPYSSRYDAVLRGRAQLSAQEARGLDLFDEPVKGNCASCHPSVPTADGAFPLFSDAGFVAVGVPRNRALPANADPSRFDLGLCGPLRTDLADRAEYCGLFRTPTLRNVAVRGTFFHNGAFRSLRDAVRFYARRDSDPQLFYPVGADGAVQKFDDLPRRYHGNVNVDPPFDRHAGDAPALSDAEVDDVVAFLETLTDGDVAAAASSRRVSAPPRCPE